VTGGFRSGQYRFELLAHVAGSDRRRQPDRLNYGPHVPGGDQVDALIVQRLAANLDIVFPLGLVVFVPKTFFLG
jgi:hypothetical protein